MTKETIHRARGFIAEFKQFAIKGNALQLAVAVVVGTAFTGMVNSLVGDIITPFLGLFTGNVDFKNLSVTLRQPMANATTTPLVVHYGSFIQSVFNFIIVAGAMFFIIKLSSATLRRFAQEEKVEKAAPPPMPPRQEQLLAEIRDLLKERKP